MEWIEGLNRALKYIEAHLEDEMSVPLVAEQARFSQFYLQRTFAMMTDMTLSEYVRQRRLSAAGRDLQLNGAKVIDVALKYGYETPESFQKAFRRFHGVTPMAAKRPSTALRYLSPLMLQVKLTGGNIMDYSVENMGELNVLGCERRFHNDTAFAEIPKFWSEYYAKGMNKVVPGYVGVCLDDQKGPDFSSMSLS